ncbi:YfgM family protein [Desulfurivibrio alkaliphilus]|uniref:Ancillary SecYEG translocon subunit n=1 Tax=Desulfurivibrio alkaliphilus (strain DSM 19089 / UNIQEM U267 / AHT2) TaxID=589865 RepID=D6Z1G9_DESAT|nr:tetratricopeptide repeat protein [Desulfurivibrio alkaliphilus]ADH85424.1 Tetratricopeptide TPR_4 [Desulfurivibrio alkaliphilus AHT 2]
MAEKKIFQPGKLKPAGSGTTNFFDELNLPPAAAEFLNVWYRHILAAIGIVVVAILTWSLSQQYVTSRAEQSSQQLSVAMQIADPAARAQALEEVASSYRRTGAGIWSRIELAHLARDAGDLEGAAQAYQELLGTISRRDARRPMVQLSLAQVLSELGQDEQALRYYRELAETPGFEAWGLLGTGDVMARRGDTEAAREKYRQVTEKTNAPLLVLEQAESRLR